MTTIERLTLTRSQLDDVAWQFLRSEFTDETYAQCPLNGGSTRSCCIGGDSESCTTTAPPTAHCSTA